MDQYTSPLPDSSNKSVLTSSIISTVKEPKFPSIQLNLKKELFNYYKRYVLEYLVPREYKNYLDDPEGNVEYIELIAEYEAKFKNARSILAISKLMKQAWDEDHRLYFLERLRTEGFLDIEIALSIYQY